MSNVIISKSFRICLPKFFLRIERVAPGHPGLEDNRMSDKPDERAVAVCFTLPKGFSVDASDWYDTSEKVESEDIMIEEVRNFVRIYSSLGKEQFMRLAEWNHRA